MTANTLLTRMPWLIVLILAVAEIAAAHVILDHPNGGEVLAGGSSAVVEWRSHATNDWDLWYSVTGPGGPWIEIVADLPPGDITTGAIHTYDWTVPALDSDQVRVRVRQDNIGTDYEDFSDGDLMITAVLFANGFESGNADAWLVVAP